MFPVVSIGAGFAKGGKHMRTVLVLVIMAALAFAHNETAARTTMAPAPETDSWLEEIGYFEVESYAGNVYSVGCGFDGEYLWVTNGAGQGGAGTGVFMLFEEDGTYVTSFPQNSAPGWGLRDLTCDGTYMYGSVSTRIDYYDITSREKVGAFYGPQNPNRALAYDGTYFYTGNFGTDVYRLTWNGVSGSTATSTLWSSAATSIYGAAWDELNQCMWTTSADYSGVVAQIDADGNLIENHTLISGGIYGGACMGTLNGKGNTLWVFEQGSPDAMHAYDVNPESLTRETWGAIKAVF